MEAKVLGETFKEAKPQVNSKMSLDMQVQMYDNENRNLRNERYRLLQHIKRLEEANLDKERTLGQIILSEEQSLQ